MPGDNDGDADDDDDRFPKQRAPADFQSLHFSLEPEAESEGRGSRQGSPCSFPPSAPAGPPALFLPHSPPQAPLHRREATLVPLAGDRVCLQGSTRVKDQINWWLSARSGNGPAGTDGVSQVILTSWYGARGPGEGEFYSVKREKLHLQ